MVPLGVLAADGILGAGVMAGSHGGRCSSAGVPIACGLVPGVPVAGVPVAGVLVAGVPVDGVLVAGILVSGLITGSPLAGLAGNGMLGMPEGNRVGFCASVGPQGGRGSGH